MGAFDSVPNRNIPDDSDPEAAAAFRRKWKWDAHEIVIIKGQFMTADQEAMENAASKLTGTGSKRDMEPAMGTARRVLLERMILDWTLADNGRKVTVSSESIKRLPSNYRTPILEACDEIAAGMSEEEQEDFLPSANGHSVASSTEMRVSPKPS